MKKLIAILAVLALVLAACGGDDSSDGGDSGGDNGGVELEGDAAAGENVYASSCATCHGPDAKGIEGLGKDLHNNAFVDGKTDTEMVDFIKVGRPAGDRPTRPASICHRRAGTPR
jgi:mono/diheme cytochrome c family protein